MNCAQQHVRRVAVRIHHVSGPLAGWCADRHSTSVTDWRAVCQSEHLVERAAAISGHCACEHLYTAPLSSSRSLRNRSGELLQIFQNIRKLPKNFIMKKPIKRHQTGLEWMCKDRSECRNDFNSISNRSVSNGGAQKQHSNAQPGKVQNQIWLARSGFDSGQKRLSLKMKL